MHSRTIVVIGSTNMDMVIKTDHIPAPGETILGGSFLMNHGGKGANQAVAVSRLGGEVTFITKLGNDLFGKQAAQSFIQEGINTSFILIDEKSPSGIALITVDAAGENSIVVAAGANANLLPADLAEALDKTASAKIILMQLEIPLKTVEYVAKYAAEKGIKVILNPAPMNKLSIELLQCVYTLTPNMNEAGILAGMKVNNVEEAGEAAKIINDMGVNNVLITLGSSGVLICENGIIQRVPSPPVKAIDSTGAGDVFNGALAVALSENKSLNEAARFACHAAAVSVTRMGAQSSIPYRNEIIL